MLIAGSKLLIQVRKGRADIVRSWAYNLLLFAAGVPPSRPSSVDGLLRAHITHQGRRPPSSPAGHLRAAAAKSLRICEHKSTRFPHAKSPYQTSKPHTAAAALKGPALARLLELLLFPLQPSFPGGGGLSQVAKVGGGEPGLQPMTGQFLEPAASAASFFHQFIASAVVIGEECEFYREIS